MAEGALAGKRILLVEDEFFVAMALEELLRSLGCHVVGPSGELDEAVGLAGAEALDAAVLDVDLRGRAVFPVAEVLAERGIGFVLATGHEADALPESFRDVPRLRKPFQAREIQSALVAAVAATAPPDGREGR